jgi:hypothetical protein
MSLEQREWSRGIVLNIGNLGARRELDVNSRHRLLYRREKTRYLY